MENKKYKEFKTLIEDMAECKENINNAIYDIRKIANQDNIKRIINLKKHINKLEKYNNELNILIEKKTKLENDTMTKLEQ